MLRKFLPHAAIILSAMYFVFYGIDRVNSAMAFIDNPMTKMLLVVLGLISIINAIFLIRDNRAKERKRQAKLRKMQEARKGQR